MKTLVQYWHERKDTFRDQVQRAINLDDALFIIPTQLNELINEYIVGLNDSQLLVANAMLDALSVSLQFPLLRRKPIKPPSHETSNSDQRGSNEQIQDASMIPGRKWVGAWVQSAVETVEGVTAKITRANREFSRDELWWIIRTQLITEVNMDALSSYLERSFASIDHAVAAAAVAPPPQTIAPSKLTDQVETLEFLQNLLGDMMDKRSSQDARVQQHLKKVTKILQREGIEILTYVPGQALDQTHPFFDFEASIDPDVSEYLTLVPALTKAGKLLLRGRVVEPVNPSPLPH